MSHNPISKKGGLMTFILLTTGRMNSGGDLVTSKSWAGWKDGGIRSSRIGPGQYRFEFISESNEAVRMPLSGALSVSITLLGKVPTNNENPVRVQNLEPPQVAQVVYRGDSDREPRDDANCMIRFIDMIIFLLNGQLQDQAFDFAIYWDWDYS
jgi:hypothetical protein